VDGVAAAHKAHRIPASVVEVSGAAPKKLKGLASTLPRREHVDVADGAIGTKTVLDTLVVSVLERQTCKCDVDSAST
jgi:hypothetical protein